MPEDIGHMSPPRDIYIRALLVEDSENDAMFLTRELKKLSPNVRTKRVETEDEFEVALDQQDWDVVLCDYNLPTFSAPEALTVLRRREMDIPMLIVSGYVGEEAAVAAMKAGARDYVSKDHLSRLGPAILRELQESETRQRHRQLEQELRQSQKLESIGRLAGGIAHDFNNLLTVIQGFAELGMKGSPADDKNAKYFNHIMDAAKSASHLTSQLLAFSRRQPLNPEVLDLNDLIGNMEKMLGRLITEDIVLATSFARSLRPVKVDRHQLEQVIINMVVNARDAMPDGGTLTLETSVATAPLDTGSDGGDRLPRECVRLSIIDTGIGMTEEVKARIFEPFFTTKEAGKGSGLGLATCYGIVKQNNGEITVTSHPGTGTRFDIWLPVSVEVEPRKVEHKEPEPPARGRETVLVVEDQDHVRELAVTVLRDQGYNVLEAADGVDALKIAEERGAWDVDMLVTDVIMPRMGGVELAERLKSLHPHMLLMFVSGYARDLLDYRSENDFWFMQKPFSPMDLATNVRQALDAQKTGPRRPTAAAAR